tara:strand:+ start:254 stop:796 length:543 start_codon:yes stop_codon:yes gene_type:complete
MKRSNHTTTPLNAVPAPLLSASLASLIALVLLAAPALQAAPTFHHDYASAAQAAKAANKPLVVIFSATWCPPCQQMKKSVYPSREVAPYHNTFVWAYLDADDPKNKALMTQNRVNGIPHIAFENASGNHIGKLTGGVAPAYFADVLREMTEKSNGSPPPASQNKNKKSFFNFFKKNPGSV